GLLSDRGVEPPVADEPVGTVLRAVVTDRARGPAGARQARGRRAGRRGGRLRPPPARTAPVRPPPAPEGPGPHPNADRPPPPPAPAPMRISCFRCFRRRLLRIRLDVPDTIPVSAACIFSDCPSSVPVSPATTRAAPVSGSHSASAATTSAGVWYLLPGFFSSILSTTSASPGGNVLSIAVSDGASFIWCWASFWVVVPENGGLPVTRAKNVAPRL